MLRRAYLGRRQQFEQVISTTKLPSNFSTSSLFSYPLSRRCPLTTAVNPQLDTSRLHSSGNQVSGSTPSVLTTNRTPAIHSSYPYQNLPTDLLFSLLSSIPSEEDALNKIRASPALSKHLSNRESARKLAEAMALRPVPHFAIRVLQLAYTLGCHHRQAAYECAAHFLASVQRWDLVLAIIGIGKAHTGKTTLRLLNWRVRALVELDRHDLLQHMLKEFHESRLRPNRRSFHLLVSGCIRNRDLARAKELLGTMEQFGIPVDHTTHAIVARYYRAFGCNTQVQNRVLRSLSALSQGMATLVLNNLMQLRLDAHDIPGSLEILSFFRPIAATPIAEIVYGVSGGTTIPGDGDRSPLSQNRLSNPIIPNAETYSIFMNHLISVGAHSQALEVFNTMMSADIPMNAESIASLIHLLFASEQGATAVKLVSDMCGPRQFPWEAFPPFRPDHTSNLPSHISGVQPTNRIMNALLKGSLPVCGLLCVEGVMQIMHANNISPNASTVEILLAYLGRKGSRPKELVRLLFKLCSSKIHIQPTIRHLHPILNSIIRHERFLAFGSGWNSIAARFNRTRGPKPSVPSSSLSESKIHEPVAGIVPLRRVDRRALRPVLEDLAKRNVKLDGVVAGLRMKQVAGNQIDVDAARDVFRMMLSRGHKPTEYHFSSLMEGCARYGDLRAATDVLRSAAEIGIKPNVVMFTILIAGYARQGHPEQAIRTFQRMIECDIRPDIAAIDAVSSAFFAVGAYVMARRTLIIMWRYIEPFPENLRSVPLKQLASAFRSIQGHDRRSLHPLSRAERIAMHQQIARLLKAWERYIVEQDGCTNKIADKMNQFE
ncbi:hypothetical protein E1B28_001175 [Marasmius oreades]|uniref:Pentatricopeptide repeat-containing protein n=1 Tax=Marasmius oreades TaxID=181124 RepID=A0A9P7V309_9AGAR|nr:uncharacterized protein E1B28_001175 [Marasmius oreades]KAG7099317.1 hypothetical protein E1B28_001175 [Marasmius oreades]